MPSFYINQCWHIVTWTFKNEFRWNLNQNTTIYIQENEFGNIVYKMAANLCMPQCDNDCMLIYLSDVTEPGSRWAGGRGGDRHSYCPRLGAGQCDFMMTSHVSWCLPSLTTPLFVQQFRLTAMQVSKLHIIGPLLGETTDDWWIPCTKGR